MYTKFIFGGFMETFLGLLGLVILIVVIVHFVNKRKEKEELVANQEQQRKKVEEERKEKELEKLKQQWEIKKRELESNGLPILHIDTLMLTKNEVCHFAGDARFCKLKQQTVGYEGGSRGVSVRVAKGISFRFGNFRGHNIRETVTEKTNGLIYLTNKKIVFSAIRNSGVIKYKEIINLNAFENLLQIQTNEKTYLFEIIDSLNFMIILEHIINKYEE